MKKRKLIMSLLTVGLISASVIIPVSVVSHYKNNENKHQIKQPKNPDTINDLSKQSNDESLKNKQDNQNKINKNKYYFITDKQLYDITTDIKNMTKSTKSVHENRKIINKYIPTLLKKLGIPNKVKSLEIDEMIDTLNGWDFIPNPQNKNIFKIMLKLSKDLKIKNLTEQDIYNSYNSQLTIIKNKKNTCLSIEFDLLEKSKEIADKTEMDLSKFKVETLKKGSIEEVIKLVKSKVKNEGNIEKIRSIVSSHINEIKTILNLPLNNLKYVDINTTTLYSKPSSDCFSVDYYKNNGINIIFIFDKDKTLDLENYRDSDFVWTYIESYNNVLFEFFVK